MKIAVVGSREYPLLEKVRTFVRTLAAHDPSVVLISGGAPGVDRTAEDTGREVGLEVISILADWVTYGRGAGMRRNTDIARQADKVVCFWDGKSKGCMDTVHKAKANGKPVVIFGPDGKVASR